MLKRSRTLFLLTGKAFRHLDSMFLPFLLAIYPGSIQDEHQANGIITKCTNVMWLVVAPDRTWIAGIQPLQTPEMAQHATLHFVGPTTPLAKGVTCMCLPKSLTNRNLLYYIRNTIAFSGVYVVRLVCIVLVILRSFSCK